MKTVVCVLKMLKHIADQQDYHYNHDALNCMFQLVANGHDEAALQVFLLIYPGSKEGSSNVLLRNMVVRGRVSCHFEYMYLLKTV